MHKGVVPSISPIDENRGYDNSSFRGSVERGTRYVRNKETGKWVHEPVPEVQSVVSGVPLNDPAGYNPVR